jgi:hypothetical protein
MVAFPILVLLVAIIGTCYITTVKVIPVVISPPVNISARIPVIIGAIRIAHHKARCRVYDQ